MKLLKPEEVAEIIGVSKGSIYNWISKGEKMGPVFFKIDGMVRIKESDLNDWISSFK